MKFELLTVNKAEEIKELYRSVFSDSGGESEGQLVGDLAYELLTETDKQDIYKFVAIEDNVIVGCIIFSRMAFESEQNVFILSPVAVQTARHGQGVGQELISFGLKKLKDAGVRVVVTYGDPNFYSMVGFKPLAVESIQPPFELQIPHGWIGQSLTSDPIKPIPGKSACVKALNNAVYW